MRAGNIELSLCAAAGAAAAGLAWSKYERGHFVTEELVFSSSKMKEPAVLVFLSDLHDNTFGEKNEKLLKEIKRIHPDAVLIGGDTMVTKPGRADLSRTKELLQGISRLSCPVFYAIEIMSRGCSGIGEFTGPCTMNFGSCWKNIR